MYGYDKEGIMQGMQPEQEMLKRQDARKLESMQSKNGRRVKDAAGNTISYYRDPSEIRQINSLKFEIEDLMTMENLQQPSKVERLQDLLNKYVLGDTVIPITGVYDNKTMQAARQYKMDSKRWHGDPHGPDMNPLFTFERYRQIQKMRTSRVGLGQ